MHHRKKRLLVISSRFPYPVIGGDRLRFYKICEELSKQFRLTLVCFCENGQELRAPIPNDNIFSQVERIYLPKWKSWLNCALWFFSDKPLQISYYRNRKFSIRVKVLADSNDAVVAHLIRTAEVVKDLNIPKFLEMTDAISLNYSRFRFIKFKLRDIRALIYKLDEGRTLKYEKKIIEKFDHSFLVSEVDRDYLCGDSIKLLSKVSVFGLGVDVSKFPYRFNRDGDQLLFIGNMNSFQNFDAAYYMASEVLPFIRGVYPNVFLKVVGRIPTSKEKLLSALPGVLVTGEVDDILPETDKSAVAVCPLRLGAGIQTKVLEYMALGIPVVSTPLGGEGLNVVNGNSIMLAESSRDIAKAVITLLQDREMAKVLAKNARKYVEENHNSHKCLVPMVSKVTETLT